MAKLPVSVSMQRGLGRNGKRVPGRWSTCTNANLLPFETGSVDEGILEAVEHHPITFGE